MSYTPRHAQHRIVYSATRKFMVGTGVTAVALSTQFMAPSAHAEVLTPDQVRSAAQQGCPQLSGAALDTAVKIATPESGRETTAHNPNGEDSRGLWQINLDAHRNVWGDLFDPVTNARAMCDVSGGGSNFTPWTTFVAGRHFSAPSGDSAAPLPAAPQETAPASPGRTYTVQEGDWLMKIAQEQLGNGGRSAELYAVNKGVIGPNPNMIQPGQVLSLP